MNIIMTFDYRSQQGQQALEVSARRPSSSIEDEMTTDWTPEMPFQNVIKTS